MSHVSHLAPALVVGVGSVWITSVVGALAVELGVVGVVHVVFDLALEGAHVLTVNLESKSPKCTLPDHACLCILDSEVVFIVT